MYKGTAMYDNGTISYSHIYVYHIKKNLQRNLQTIESLVKMIEATGSFHCSMDDILKTASDEISTCIRILDTEGVHV
jgi:hypothetical protein